MLLLKKEKVWFIPYYYYYYEHRGRQMQLLEAQGKIYLLFLKKINADTTLV